MTMTLERANKAHAELVEMLERDEMTAIFNVREVLDYIDAAKQALEHEARQAERESNFAHLVLYERIVCPDEVDEDPPEIWDRIDALGERVLQARQAERPAGVVTFDVELEASRFLGRYGEPFTEWQRKDTEALIRRSHETGLRDGAEPLEVLARAGADRIIIDLILTPSLGVEWCCMANTNQGGDETDDTRGASPSEAVVARCRKLGLLPAKET